MPDDARTGDAPRFICDEMLKRLARWLRAAGYDTLVAEDGARDGDVLARARREGRLVVTRDRKLADHRGANGFVVALRANSVEGAAAELAAALDLDWLWRPFSRCLVCNAPLVAAADDARARVPERARALPGPITACPACGRVYWPGGHVRRMRAKLERWSAAREAAP